MLSKLTTLLVMLLLLCIGAQANDEAALIAVLQSSASAAEKAEAARQLRLAGTDTSVPALAALLREDATTHAARYALEGVASPAADAALRAALVETAGLVQAGIADSMGRRQDAAGVPLLTPLLHDTHSTVAISAATALGNIGNAAALTALSEARNKVSPIVRHAVIDALLQCAEQQLAAGKPAAATAIYESLGVPTESEFIRVAARVGMMRAAGPGALDRMVAALRENDLAAQTAALSLAHELALPNAARRFTDLLPSSPPALQIALLAWLTQHGDEAALPAVREMARSSSPAVRTAAATALGTLGDTSVIRTLATLATARDAGEQKAAREALTRLKHGPVAAALVKELTVAPPAEQMEIIRALTARQETAAVPELLALARSESPATRRAALRALARLTDAGHLPALVELLITTGDPATREEIQDVFESVADRIPPGETPDISALVRGLGSADVATRVALLRVSAFFVNADLRRGLRQALKDSDEQIREAATRAICQTRDAELMPDLLKLARDTSEIGLHALALERYVRLTDPEWSALTASKRADLLQKAMTLTRRPEEQRMILANLARVPHPLALTLTRQACTEPATAAAAEIATLQIAKLLLPSANAAEAEAAISWLATNAGNESARTEAATLWKKLDTKWLVTGPYRQAGREAQELFDIAFPPEQAGGDTLEWRAAPVSPEVTRPSEVDLSSVVKGDHAVAYLKTRVYVPIPQPVTFLMGSDDGGKLWVNGELVHANNAVRGLTPDEDKVTGRLHQGWNELLVKITQHTAGCGMTLRLTEPDGKDVPGVRFDPRGGTQPRATGFRRLQLSDQFYTEGAYYADFNRDGHSDVVAGPYWFAGPDFTARHEYRPARSFSPKEYSDNFLTYAADLNGNGWPDILCVPFPGKEGYWYENPAGHEGHWKQHLYYNMVGNESPLWGDVTGDGRPELIFCNEGFLGYAGPDPADPTQPWPFRAISHQDKRFQRFTHGAGLGNINGDGRMDIVEGAGWWKQPAFAAPDQPWIFHPFQFAAAGAQMLVYDVDGDGHADIITTWHAHEYGLLWWQQVPRPGQPPDWQRHVILEPQPDLASPALRISQLHAFDLVDMNGDGLKDIVTGKRFWAHGPAGDPEPNAPAVLYWFELQRGPGGNASFIPHLIDDDSGVGTQVTAADLNGDGRPDIIVGNKKGIFLHLSGQIP